jgi:photosystem II stability/assembly factor-like uncharacterized protein
MRLRWRTTPLLLLALALLGAPAAWAGTWTRIGPEGGTMTSFTSIPGRPATLYAGFLDGGIFRSDDRGATWRYAGRGSGRLAVLALAPDARDPETLYAASRTLGVVKTVNGGSSWKAVTQGLPPLGNLGISAIAADGRTGGLAYAALRQGGLYKTVDGGKRWTALPASAPRDVRLLVTDPRVGGTVYAVTTSGGLLKSTNAGSRWRSIRRGLEGYDTTSSLHIDPRNSQILYTLAANTQQGRLFKTVDGGAKWSPIDTPEDAVFYSFALDPNQPSTLYLGVLEGILRSRDGGKTWDETLGAPEGTQFRVWAGAATVITAPFGGGFFRSADRGDHWTPARGIRALSSMHLAVAPGHLYTLSVTPGAVEQRSDDQGRTWSPLTPLTDRPFRRFGDIFVLDPKTPSTIYAGFNETLARSTDAGDHWDAFSTPPCLLPRFLTLDPVNPENLYVAGDIPLSCPVGPTACGVYRKLGSGDWECIKGELPGIGLSIAAVDPFTPSNLYAFFPGALLRSTDRGSHWSYIALINFLTSIALDPTRPGVVYAGFLRGTGRSYDGGITWDMASTGIPSNSYVEQLVVDPTDGATLYALTVEEVYRSDDEGRTWKRAAPGLGETIVRQIALDPTDPSILYAATAGGGVLRLEQE